MQSVTADVWCTLEGLYLGTTKKYKIVRQCLSASRTREHILELQVRGRQIRTHSRPPG
jgi:hypothetical protein